MLAIGDYFYLYSEIFDFNNENNISKECVIEFMPIRCTRNAAVNIKCIFLTIRFVFVYSTRKGLRGILIQEMIGIDFLFFHLILKIMFFVFT